MGKYATTTSISRLLPGFLAGNTTTSDTAGVDLFSLSADRAEAMVDASLVNRWDPSGFTTTAMPPLLRMLSEDIAAGLTLRAAYTQDGQNKNEYVEEHFSKALATLEKLEKGEIGLAFTNGALVATRGSARYVSSSTNYTQIFGLDEPTQWKRDETEVTDQEAARD